MPPMVLSLSEEIKALELLVKIPFYSVAGFAGGNIIYVSDVEGVMGLWSLDPMSGESRRLTKEPIHSVAGEAGVFGVHRFRYGIVRR